MSSRTHTNRWFAVDQDGYVGLFDTQGIGVVPRDAAFDYGELDVAVERLRIAQCMICDPDTKQLFGEIGAAAAAADTAPTCVYVVVAPEPQDVEAYRQGTPRPGSFEARFCDVTWIIVRDGMPRVLLSEQPLSSSQIAAVRAHPHVRLVAEASELGPCYGNGEDLDDTGIIEFMSDWGTDKYTRCGPMGDRLQVSALPPVLRAAATKVTLGLRFADHLTIRMYEHFALDQLLANGGVDGETEAQYRRACDRLGQYLKLRRRVAAFAPVGIPLLVLIVLLGWLARSR